MGNSSPRGDQRESSFSFHSKEDTIASSTGSSSAGFLSRTQEQSLRADAVICFKNQEYSKAEKLLLEARKSAPKDHETMHMLARLYDRMDYLDKAEACYIAV